MKVPQLWQKWHRMMAQTSLRLSSLPQGIRLGLSLLLVLATM
jgi:hypothetical protein